MADYTQAVLFGPKDGLTSGDPNKLIRGTEIDGEYSAIATAIATKYDDTDIASLAQAQAETSDAVLITPLKLANWSDANGGLVGDIHSLTDPNDDRILFWDDGAGAVAFLDIGTNLNITGTTISAPTATLEGNINHDNLLGFVGNEHIDHSSVSISAGTGLTGGGTIAANRTLSLDTGNTRNTDHASVTLTAGVGLTGGGNITASRTFDLDITGLTTATPVGTDEMAFHDVGVGVRKATINAIFTAAGSVPTARTITAGVGLTGGGDLSADRTIDLDIDTLVAATPVSTDELAFDDTGVGTRKATIAAIVQTVAASETATGVVERATQTEANTGTDTTRYISPATLANLRPATQSVVTTLAIDGSETFEVIFMQSGDTLQLNDPANGNEGKHFRVIHNGTSGTCEIEEGSGTVDVRYSVGTGNGTLGTQSILLASFDYADIYVVSATEWHVSAPESGIIP